MPSRIVKDCPDQRRRRGGKEISESLIKLSPRRFPRERFASKTPRMAMSGFTSAGSPPGKSR